MTALLLMFSLITPLGILMGMLSDIVLHTHLDDVLTACFNAIAAGTFLYIGTAHSHRLRNHHHDSHQQYVLIIATIIGVFLMGTLAIWI